LRQKKEGKAAAVALKEQVQQGIAAATALVKILKGKGKGRAPILRRRNQSVALGRGGTAPEIRPVDQKRKRASISGK